MIGDQNHGSAGCLLHQSAEHLVVQFVACMQYAVVKVKVFLTDSGAARRVEFHESVPEVIDGIEIDGAEIPLFAIHQPRGCRVNIRALGDNAGDRVQPVVTLLVDFEQREARRPR